MGFSVFVHMIANLDFSFGHSLDRTTVDFEPILLGGLICHFNTNVSNCRSVVLQLTFAVELEGVAGKPIRSTDCIAQWAPSYQKT